jgi:hypothetical protein
MIGSTRPRLARLDVFEPAGGYCFAARTSSDLGPADSSQNPYASPLLLFEDGVELGPPHTLHETIRGHGLGHFSHWRNTLLFSTSDNSDPRSNGRDYSVYAPHLRGGPLQSALGVLTSLPEDYTPAQAYAAVERCLAELYPRAKLGEDLKSFWNDVPFIDTYRRFAGDNYRALERKFTVYNLVNSLHWQKGDIAECGVYNGGTAYFMALAVERAGTGRGIHLFDSFEGLSSPGTNDGDYWHDGDLACSEDAARRNLAGFSNLHFYPGWIPARFPAVAERDFCFVHIDVDIWQPTRDSIEFFYPRLRSGGMMVCDDYGFDSCPGARRAMDDFFAERPECIIHLPTGQGLVLKL